jgi:hypothetical protein
LHQLISAEEIAETIGRAEAAVGGAAGRITVYAILVILALFLIAFAYRIAVARCAGR